MNSVKRNGIIDIYRLIAILIIMDNHIGMAGLMPIFPGGYLAVEFFLFLTGYLTCRHFDKASIVDEKPPFALKAKSVILYTFNKFKAYVPLIMVFVLAQYILTYAVCYDNFPGRQDFLCFINDLPNEMLLLKTAYGSPLVGPLWYMSALFIVFPVFCLFLQLFDRYTFTIIALLASIIYIGKFGIGDYFAYPMCLPRAFFELLIGALIYYGGAFYINSFYEKVNTGVLVVIELLLIGFTVLLYRDGYDYACYLLLWSLVLVVSVGMSPKLSGIGAVWTAFLGKLSLPLFVTHWFVVTYIGIYHVGWADSVKRIVFYAGSVILSLLYMLVSHMFNLKRIRDKVA